MKIILIFFITLTAIGLFLSFIFHLYSFFQKNSLLDKISIILTCGFVVVYFPAVIISYHIIQDYSRTNFWNIIFRNNPEWIKYMTIFFFIYGFLSITILVFKSFLSLNRSNENHNEANFTVATQDLSGMIMSFYSSSLAIFYACLNIINN